MKRKKKLLFIILIVVLMCSIVFLIGRSFGFFKYIKKGETVNVITINGIETEILNPENDALNLENAYPMTDREGLALTPFEFRMTNTSNRSLSYSIQIEMDDEKLDACTLEDGTKCPELSPTYLKYVYKKNDGTYTEPRNLASNSNIIASGVITEKETITSSIILWIDEKAGNEIMNHYFYGKIVITGALNTSSNYQEAILNGADPVLTNNLIPVQIAEDGTVTKANTNLEWYSYEKKNWANAVVLKDEGITYQNGETIPEDNIESYFVWIPKYSYQLWDLGNYSSLTSIEAKEQTIPIKFGLTNTSDSNTGECTTPGVAGSSGSCQVGDYMTHPAFLAFDSNGLWVGKFETGYDGATSTSGAQVNSSDSSKIIIKPNVYSWRSLTVGNMFSASYNYIRSDESHMMKNTEWGAVAYLQHSQYGSAASVRINNNSNFITGYAGTTEPTLGYNSGISVEGNRVELTSLGVDGTYTVNYLNTLSNVASTTGNKSGIYDMSGGTGEYVMGYTTGASTIGGNSGITTLYPDFFINSSWEKYYDEYSSNINTDYHNRILGDATGEMGPFGTQVDPDSTTRYKSSWYGDYTYFVYSSNPWFIRGSDWRHGTDAGDFAFAYHTGTTDVYTSFRVVLAPTK